MSEHPQDQPSAERGENHGDAVALEASLNAALTFRSGGSFGEAMTAPHAIDEDRFAAIEAAVDAGDKASRRQVTFLAVAAAMTVVLFISLALARGSENVGEVQSHGGTTTSVALPSTTIPDRPVSTATAGTSVPPAGDIRNVDLKNFTYPSSACDRNDPQYQPTFTLVDGEAEMRSPSGDPALNHIVVRVHAVHHGDVTGDGIDDAVVMLLCAPNGTDGTADVAVIVSETAGGPTVLGSISASGSAKTDTGQFADGTTYVFTQFEQVIDVSFANGQLRLRWNQSESPNGIDYLEQRRVTVTYRWDGTSFTPAGESDVEIIPAQPQPTYAPPPTSPPSTVPPPTPDLNAIQRLDLRSVTIPLATSGREPWQVACADIFGAATAPAADATLVDGEAVVTDAAGNPLVGPGGEALDAKVAIALNIAYRDVTRDGIEEALILVRCSTNVAAARVPVFFHVVDGEAQVLEALPPPPGLLWANYYTRGDAPIDIIHIGWLDRELPGTPVRGTMFQYRWDGARFQTV